MNSKASLQNGTNVQLCREQQADCSIVGTTKTRGVSGPWNYLTGHKQEEMAGKEVEAARGSFPVFFLTPFLLGNPGV